MTRESAESSVRPIRWKIEMSRATQKRNQLRSVLIQGEELLHFERKYFQKFIFFDMKQW